MDGSETTTEYPATGGHMVAALNAALATGNLDRIMGALGEMTRAHRMRRVAQETGLGRESLYKSMRAGASPEFATVLKVARALGLHLRVEPVHQEHALNQRRSKATSQ